MFSCFTNYLVNLRAAIVLYIKYQSVSSSVLYTNFYDTSRTLTKQCDPRLSSIPQFLILANRKGLVRLMNNQSSLVYYVFVLVYAYLTVVYLNDISYTYSNSFQFHQDVPNLAFIAGRFSGLLISVASYYLISDELYPNLFGFSQ